MKSPRSCLLAVGLAVLITAFGCVGGETQPPPVDLNAQAKAKVESMKRLADVLATDAKGIEARAALEDFVNQQLDVAKNPQEADEILDIYRTRIKGKYQSEVVSELQAQMAGIENAKKSK